MLNTETKGNPLQAETLQELTSLMQVQGCTKINISFKTNRVTVGYRKKGVAYGARGETLTEAFHAAWELLLNINPKNQTA